MRLFGYRPDIYDLQSMGKVSFIFATGLMVGIFIYISSGLVSDLSSQERDRMEIWAEATKEIVETFAAESDTTLQTEPTAYGHNGVNLDFLLSIIERNTNIPVVLVDDYGNILQSRNFSLPDEEQDMSEANMEFLREKVKALSETENVIDINIGPGLDQHLYYEDSTLLKRLSLFPYIELVVMLAFIIVVYLAVVSTTRSEQNKVWVGLSKETAHQLGTPISSLMAWMELLPELGVDKETVSEMDKDVKRLSEIASRFSKIGSKPTLELRQSDEIASGAVTYMKSRISSRINLEYRSGEGVLSTRVKVCAPLFEWVLENLIKNAVDAMPGSGDITVTSGVTNAGKGLYFEISDTGKGIRRKDFKKVFSPGFTTKKRGWGLGLTLAKRIVEQYHQGRIYVKSSTPGVGTTFRIELPAITGTMENGEWRMHNA